MSRPSLKRLFDAVNVLGSAKSPSTLSRSRRSYAMLPGFPSSSSRTTRFEEPRTPLGAD